LVGFPPHRAFTTEQEAPDQSFLPPVRERTSGAALHRCLVFRCDTTRWQRCRRHPHHLRTVPSQPDSAPGTSVELAPHHRDRGPGSRTGLSRETPAGRLFARSLVAWFTPEIPSNSPDSFHTRSEVHGAHEPFESTARTRRSHGTRRIMHFSGNTDTGTPKVAELSRPLARSATLDADDDRTPDHECSLMDPHDARRAAVEANRRQRLSHRRRPARSPELPMPGQS